MISFSIALLILIAGYFTYGVFVSKVFGQDSARPTPVHTMADGVDYVKLSTWKIFLIQFLNIAGLGPIFGAIMGVMFGPAAFLWIVFGTIFAGAVHDYMSGILSLRNNGASLPEIWGDMSNRKADAAASPIFPMMFVSIACGAISGFHATQSPMMARCLQNEKHARPVFYGAMVTEGIVALIWAAAAIAFTGSPIPYSVAVGAGTMVSVVFLLLIARYLRGLDAETPIPAE